MVQTKKGTRTAANKTASEAKKAVTAVKETTEKAAAPAKKTAASAKRTAAKAEEVLKAVVHIQFGGDKDIIAKDILDKAVENYKASHKDAEVKNIELYIVPEKNTAYYVVNGEESEENQIQL